MEWSPTRNSNLGYCPSGRHSQMAVVRDKEFLIYLKHPFTSRDETMTQELLIEKLRVNKGLLSLLEGAEVALLNATLPQAFLIRPDRLLTHQQREQLKAEWNAAFEGHQLSSVPILILPAGTNIELIKLKDSHEQETPENPSLDLEASSAKDGEASNPEAVG